MASASKDITLDTEDQTTGPRRRDSKKRKFKPLSAMRKFFGGGKSKRKSVPEDENDVASAASDRPTSAPLYDERRPTYRPLGDNRNQSEDSIFSPDQEANLQTQKMTSAGSEISLPKASFQAELFTKLNKRRSLHGDTDNDGLHHSPAPPADVIVSETAQPVSRSAVQWTAGGCDIHSGITTMESIHTEQEDPFRIQWSSAVSSTKSTSNTDLSAGDMAVDLDLSKMAQTELLKSDIAKDRISVKPRSRKTNWQSRKRREGRYSLSLPSLVEVVSDNGRRHSAARPRSEYIDPALLSDFDINMLPTAVSSMELSGPERCESTTVQQSATHTSTTSPPNIPTTMQSDKQVDSKRLAPKDSKTSRVTFATELTETQVSSSTSKTANEVNVVPASVQPALNKEPEIILVTSSAPSDLQSSGIASAVSSEDKSSVISDSLSTSVAVTSTASSASGSPDKTDDLEQADNKNEGLRQSDSQTNDAFSPKPDYKIRRQQRSKTLPVNQPAVTVQRTASQRAEGNHSPVATRHQSLRRGEKVAESAKKEEPEWIALARRKSKVHEEIQESLSPACDAVKNSTATPESSTPSAPTATTTSNTSFKVNNSNVTTASPSIQSSSTKTTISIVSSASSKQDVTTENQTGEKWRGRGGSVKTPSTTVHPFHNRGSSVKVTAMRSHPNTSPVSTSPVSPKITHPSLPSSTSISSFSASQVKQEIKEEVKSPPSTVVNDVPKWKTQSTKTHPTYSNTSSTTPTSGSVHSSVKTSPVKTSPVKTSPVKTSPVKTSPVKTSPVKTSPVHTPHHNLPSNKNVETKPISSERKSSLNTTHLQEEKKSNVPAWRANLSQKSPTSHDVKIELIENTPDNLTPRSNRKISDSKSRQESLKKGNAGLIESDQCRTSAVSTKNSRVMDLLKNFENAQSVS